jgi:hypothetical protein
MLSPEASSDSIWEGSRPRFRLTGDFWDLVFESEQSSMKTSRGMRYIAYLLSRPNPKDSIPALELSQQAVGHSSVTLPCQPPPAGEDLTRAEHTFQPALDEKARSEYQGRLQEIEDDLSEAGRNNDLGRKRKLEEEKGQIIEELKRALALHGKDRSLGPETPSRRAAKAIAQALDRALRNIGERMPKLEAHLKASIRREATAFAYRPGPSALAWDL